MVALIFRLLFIINFEILCVHEEENLYLHLIEKRIVMWYNIDKCVMNLFWLDNWREIVIFPC